MTIGRKTFKKTFYIAILIGILSLLTVSIPVVYADGALTLGATLVGNPASVQTGETVEYIIDFSCGGVTGDCGNLEINFQLDSELGFLEVIAPPGYFAEENPIGSGNIYIRTDPIGRSFQDGEAGQVTVRAVVTQDLDDFLLEGTVTGTIANGPSGPPQVVNVPGPNVPIEIPDGGWTTDKQRTSPGGSLGPIENGSATYEVSACPQVGALGIARLDSVTIQDTFPAGAVPQLPIPNGGVVSGNTITWTFNFPDPNYHTTDDGCITVSYTLDYPTPGFTYGSDITNNYVITATTPDVDFPDPGVCGVPDCMGGGSEPGTVDPPSVTIGGDKTGPGINAIVGPGNSNGYSTFDLSWNLSNANTGTSNFIFADVFPVALDGDPIIEVTAFSSGTWGGGHTALVQVATVQNPNPANDADWITIDTVTGAANQTYTNGVTAGYPDVAVDLITGVRWNFTGSTVPAGFSSAGIELQFFVRAGMTPADYDEDGAGPANYHDYDNCLYFSGDYQDQFNATQAANTGNVCDTLRIGEDTTNGFANIITSKSSSPTAVFPLQDIQFTLTINLTQEASGDLINPIIEDVLPFGMQIVSWDSVTLPGGVGVTNNPYLAVDTVAGTHPVTGAAETLQRLRFYWDDTALLPNSYECAAFPCTMDTDINTFTLDGVTATTPPGGLNGISVPPPDTGLRTLQIAFTAQARVDTPATDDSGNTVPYSNPTSTTSDSPNLVCQGGNGGTDASDIDEDGNNTEVVCNTSSNYEVREAAQMNSQKWIRNTDPVASFDFLAYNDLDAPPPASCPTYTFGTDTYTRFPCVAQGLPGSQFEYLLRVINTGLVDTDEYIMYDILPHEPDFGVSEALEASPRDTEFRVFLTAPITYENPLARAGAPTFTVEYYEEIGIPAFNPCRPEMSQDFNEAYNPAGCGGGTWTATPFFDAGTGTYPNVTAFRIIQSNSGTGYISPGEQLIFTVPMEIDDTPGEAETGEISWNTFAQRFTNFPSDARLLTAEPRKVGIVVEPRYSVGNRVWIDDGAGGGIAANGIVDGAEVGINGVEVHLYQNTGGGFVLYAIDETRTDVNTGVDGFYFFGNLPGGDSITYEVRIPASEFGAGQPLDNYISSYGEVQSALPNAGFDERDNGIDPAVLDDYSAGISSAGFTLTDDDEFTNELAIDTNTDGNFFPPIGGSPNDPTDETTTGRGETYESDSNSDLTVDMGFFKPMSLGNRVWLDDGAGGGTVNNGVIDGAEAGIANVVLRLFAGDGTTPIISPETGVQYEVTTDAQGYYLFDLLPPGQYVVHVIPENFQFGATPADPDGPLADYISSDSVGIPGTPAENPVDENGVEYFGGVDEEDDRTDHGVDPLVDGSQRTLGVFSSVITLTTDSETTSELPGDKSAAGDGRRTTENNSDLTVDFGFFQESATNFSLGNFVWYDINNDGIYDPDGLDNIGGNGDDETGIPDVEMTLWSVDAGGNPLAALATTTTDAQGYYVFANLDPGRYIVQMTARNWQTVIGLADLSEYISSTGSTGDTELDSDVNENGVDPVDGNADNTVTDEYAANGVFSVPILLEPQGEPLTEPSNQPNPGAGSGGADDDNSDLTIDFGVFRPMSIGNIVWLDSGITAGGVNIAQYNDGIRNGTEPGIANVVVELYRDEDGDGTPETLYGTDTTDANGYYLFGALPPGNYRVDVVTGNFAGGQPLVNLVSSQDAAAPLDSDIDDDDHGIDVPDPTVAAVSSPVIVLAYNTEPLESNSAAAGGDPDSSNNPLDGPQFRGNNGESDDNSDRTVDFGFIAPPMSIGNRVFFDSGDNGANPTQYDDGIQNGAEPGIDGVLVNLYLASDTTTPISSALTAAGGYYIFDGLPPGDYVVGIPASNFTGVLQGYVSSTDVAAPLDADPDFDDHGINPAIVGNEVFSPTITLTTNGENQVDDEAVTGTGSGGTITDNNSDLTVDFGFIRPMSIGNRVWLDTDRVAGVLGDGILHTGEAGIANVALELYLDNGGVPGVLDGGDTLIAETLTNATGHYLFDETTTVIAPGTDDPNDSPIGPGSYLVHIPAANFAPAAPLEGLINSDGTNGTSPQPDVPVDNALDDATGIENGVDAVAANPATYPAVAGVTSTTINLNYDSEPVGETERDPNRLTDIDGVNVADINSDFTVDFGFYSALAIGNRVWFDSNANGLIDPADDNPAAPGNPGIDGVTVYLYEDFITDGVPDGLPVATAVTANGGYYLFDQTGDQSIPNGGTLLAPGNYLVGIDPAANGVVLANHISTITIVGGQGNDADIDNDDNGIDVVGPGIILSETIALAQFTETETEAAGDKEAGVGDGRYGIQNNSSNLTVDFGFFQPMSIGNIIWLDNGSTGAGFNPAQFNDGIRNGTEPGIAGVTVELYGDFDGDGVEDALPRTDVTDANGYYLFDGLAEGDYRVEIPTTNFTTGAPPPLQNLVSSTSNPAPVDAAFDDTDHGIDVADVTTTPVVSPTIELRYFTEPLETDPAAAGGDPDDSNNAADGPDFRGTNGEQDNNSDRTVDFGFVTPPMSIGNRVFFDSGDNGTNPTQYNDGIQNGTEPGIDGVLVNLYFAADTTTPIASVTTALDGYYLFDDLPPGDYVVGIPASNFTGVLQGYSSSTDFAAPLDGDPDADDHGINPATIGNEVFSPTITLAGNSEPSPANLPDDDEAVTGTGLGGTITDNNSDLTVDFGFIRPMSIGNRVWLDIDRTTGILGDGTRQGTETGIANVALELYRDNGTTPGVLDAGDTLIAETTTTDTGNPVQDGYYLFDETTTVIAPGVDDPNDSPIGPGDYLVHIPAANFAPAAALEGLINSDGAFGSGTDTGQDSEGATGDENGVNAVSANPATYPVNVGVTSTSIALRFDEEPDITAETDRDPNQPAASIDGVNVEDDNGDFTVDFGFYNALAIGNRVWFDGNRDGLIDGTDDNPNAAGVNPGIDGVTVYLYEDFITDGVPDGPPIAIDVTANGGYYLFDQTGDQSILNGGNLLVPGNYIVGIDPTAGANGTVLANHVNTITIVGGQGPDADIDSDDNGIDRRDVAPAAPPAIIYSETINLASFTEVETETDLEAGIGDGRYGIQDHSSNLTVDFGFFIPMSIGNRVWLDTNNDAQFTPGDPLEPGIDGVIVELFRDDGSGINPATDTPYRTTVTNDDPVSGEMGYYIFDDLPPGDYIVRLAPANFQPDDGNPANGVEGALLTAQGPYSSSESGAPPADGYLLDNQTDNNDNGIDANFPQIDGIVSNVINLSYNNEPDTTDDDDLDSDIGEGTFGELDFNADMTVDFGVYAPAMSIGNRVFYDYDNNRMLDGADTGVANVIVNLFRDDNQDGIPDSGITNPIATTTTDADGYYIFDGLQAGFYLVQIDEDNFRAVTNGVLQDFYSSQDKDAGNAPTPAADDGDDTIENGVDNPFNLANNPDPQAQGVFSPTIQLQPSGEVINEADLGPEGDGQPNIQPSNSDLTVDFGFYQPMSIGNVVWFDTNADGLFNGAEAGIAGVEVYLYLDNGDGVFDTATDTIVPVFDGAGYVNFDTTDANGYYLFDNLTAGQYYVHIDAGNFAATGDPLFNHFSTVPNNVPNPGIAPAPDTDSNDNGTPDDATAVTVGVTSELITLGILDPVNGSGLYIPNGSEPINEIDKSNNPPNPPATYDGPTSIGRYGETDENSDITIDFGFILANNASMSIGNRVWFDSDRSGLIESLNADGQNEDAAGIDGVTVLLYRANAAGTPIGAPIARDVTANGGYYLFDVLDTDAATGTGDGDGLGGPITPGNYVVAIEPGNFTAGNILEGYTSTITGVDNPGTAAPSTGVEAGYGAVDDDNNDNGDADPTYGVLSNLITLTLQNERDDEDAANKEAGVLDGTDSNGNPITFDNSDLTVDFGFYVPMSIGNRVWVDTNNNGVFDTGEVPVADGVTLTLYRDTDGSGDYTPGVDVAYDDPGNPGNPYQVTTTNGYYLFEDLQPYDDYIVVIDPANFAGGLLNGYTGSDNGGAFEDDTDTDLNDNGRDAAGYDPATEGIPSGLIELTISGEPTGEAVSGNPADGPNGRGNNGETDLNSNLTVDFGVFPSTYYSIGNRIWADTNNDGIHDPTEPGIPGVFINLYLDANLDGVPDSLAAIDSTTTDADGYYLFDELPEGNYIVSVAPQNFNTGGALIGYSTTNQADPTDSDPNDDDDSVSDHNNTVIDPDFGIFSNTYNLSGTTEPAGEVDPTAAGAPQDPGQDPSGNPIPDTQSNLTVDFGFIQTMSLGNRVWFDLNDDGIINAGESGIAGVDVVLYLDDGATSPGVFDPAEDTQIAIDTTDGNGYYLFNDLQPGDYFVNIPNSNWAGPLANMQSSTPVVAPTDNADNNDNGTPNTIAPVNGVTSDLITMAFGTAPTNETDLSNNPLDGPNFRGTSNPANNNSDLSWDFGFFLGTPMSIGNRVWFDDGGTTGIPNNGILEGDEAGVPNVIVELYADSNGDGIPDTTTPIDTVNTDPDGYYLFDGLPPGQYVVVLSEDNWTNGTLDGYLSTTDGTPDNDSQDNGVDNSNPANGGITSGTIVLTVGGEPSPGNPPDDDEAVTGTGSNGETDDNSNLTVDFGLVVSYDWGDNPDTYGTTNANNGPSHRIVSNLYLGAGVDDEGDGQPVAPGVSNNTADPGGDGTDEDGMVPPVFISGTTVDVDVTAVNNTGQAATLVGWFDWNGNGTFEAGEGATVNVPNGTNGVVQLTVTIPINASVDTGGNTYARLRLTNDPITTADPTGAANSGEVEDYYIEILAPGLLINKSDGRNAIVAGTVNTYTITVENSGAPRLGVRFLDDIPLATPADATGYDPDTITWTCVATNGASCVASQPPGTGASDGPFAANAPAVIIDELIDLPTNGRVVYTITGRVNAQAGLVPPGGSGPIINVAQLPNEVPPLEDRDETDVIFDPPFGVKTGVALSNTIIRWTMVWYNPGAQQTGITIGDDVTPPQSLPATAAGINLQCSGGGAGGTNTGTCSIVGNRIEWNGTMDTSTPANPAAAVRIAFNVTVPGPGNYSNSATITPPGQPSVTTSGNVTVGNPDNSDDGNPIQVEDPTIVKFVNPAFALEGEDVVWTIVVRNPNSGVQVDNVSVTDSVPPQFEIQSTSASVGTVTVSGQNVSWTIGSLAPLQEVSLTIVTRLRPDQVIDPPIVTNTAFLMTQASASADVSIVSELPNTGEVPLWRIFFMAGAGISSLIILLLAGMHYMRRARV